MLSCKSPILRTTLNVNSSRRVSEYHDLIAVLFIFTAVAFTTASVNTLINQFERYIMVLLSLLQGAVDWHNQIM